jgi:hypothetical protein
MRSVIDWHSELYGPKRNPYLRLGQADRAKLGIRTTIFFIVVAALFAMWRLLRDWIA